MIEIDDKIVSLDLLRECFACDLSRCKGICCVEGNAGAPLEIEEVATLEAQYETYKPYMTPEGIAAVERQGFMVVDDEGDYTTPLVGDAECAYSYTENGVTLCAVERAFREGRCSSIRSASCASRTVRWASTITAGRFAGPRWSAAAGWASPSTRPFGSRSCGVSAKSSTGRSKRPKSSCTNRSDDLNFDSAKLKHTLDEIALSFHRPSFHRRGRAPASPEHRPHAQTPARDPAGDRLPRKGAGRDAQTAERAAAGRIDRIRRRGDRRRHAPFGQRRSDDRPVQRQHMEIPPQPRLRQGQRNLHPLLGHDQTLSLPRSTPPSTARCAPRSRRPNPAATAT